jgi:hypothetical protein
LGENLVMAMNGAIHSPSGDRSSGGLEKMAARKVNHGITVTIDWTIFNE